MRSFSPSYVNGSLPPDASRTAYLHLDGVELDVRDAVVDRRERRVRRAGDAPVLGIDLDLELNVPHGDHAVARVVRLVARQCERPLRRQPRLERPAAVLQITISHESTSEPWTSELRNPADSRTEAQHNGQRQHLKESLTPAHMF